MGQDDAVSDLAFEIFCPDACKVDAADNVICHLNFNAESSRMRVSCNLKFSCYEPNICLKRLNPIYLNFSVDSPISARMTAMIQKRITIVGSDQPFFSKW